MALSPLLFLLPALSTTTAPHGAYVEARTASVYAGACHYGAEFTTQGREAVVAFRFDGGSHAGVELGGTALVCVVAAKGNLAEPGCERSSVVWTDAAATPEARAAALAWARAEHAALLGTVRAVRCAPLAVEVEPLAAPADVAGAGGGERYAVQAGEAVRLAGELLPERRCCRMPYDRWYAPLAPVAGALVGHTAELALDVPALSCRWWRSDENDAFVGRFGAGRPVGAVGAGGGGGAATR